MIKIITDTASDITLEQAKKMDIILLPLPVSFGETPYDQLADENLTRFYDMLEQSKVFPITSQPSPGDYMEIFADAKKNHDSVIVIPLSSGLSGSWQTAHMVKEMTDYENIYIIDARQVSIGQRLLVEYAVRLRSEGKSADDIAVDVLEASERVHFYAVLDTLIYVMKGGRISKSAGIVGSALNIKPVVCLREGIVRIAGKARGWKGAMTLLFEFISESMEFDPSFPFYFAYAKNNEHLNAFLKVVKSKLDLPANVTYPAGGLIGSYSGPNAIAVAWMTQK